MLDDRPRGVKGGSVDTGAGPGDHADRPIPESTMLDHAAQSERPGTAASLGEVLANRRWRRCELPFPHVVAEDVFDRGFYLDLLTTFERLLAGAGDDGFRRDMPGFDAAGHNFRPPVPPPFDVFFSRPWHDVLTGLFGVEGTGQMSGGLHHHQPGSRSGDVHNDLNPGWFVEEAGPGEVVVADREVCDYSTGRTRRPGPAAVEAVRGVAMIFYLANPAWAPGDGGETGLYRHAGDDVHRPAATVPPRDNSLVAFECTPFSFHAFLENRRRPRSSLVAWAHRRRSDVVERWGEGVIVPWASSRRTVASAS
jgi:2OG-Fe(II) oxygenase superfamily